ncbi:MAG: phosphotransferase [Muribaculaceae bacterium]|nr:phosphotransferase [Muribaculaceae bacterium]
MNTLTSLYRETVGSDPTRIEGLASSGSNRRYYRLCGERNLVGVLGTSREENIAFIELSRHFGQRGLPVPEVVAVSDDEMAYLQSDLGDTMLFDAIEKGRLTRAFSAEEKELLARTIRMLPDVQFNGAVGLDFSKCYPLPQFDTRTVMWDLNYFKYCFLKATGLEFSEDRLEDDFQAMAEVLMRSMSSTFMYRDFQSRNVMLRDGNPYFIDYQGGRKGPYFYDVASFLWQAKANFPESLRRELIGEYIDSLRRYVPVDEVYFMEQLRHFVLFRTLQVLGAYGFRGYFEKKPHFMQSVPFAVANLRELLEKPFAEYPYLTQVLRNLCDMKQFSAEAGKRALTVKVMSFAYKTGIPADESGNGGGFVFDCRAVNNPGKYDRYKTFTCIAQPVIKFL